MSIQNKLDGDVYLNANPKFSYQGDVNVQVENIADAIIYRKEPVQSKSSNSMSFYMDISEHWLDRGVYINRESVKVKFSFLEPPSAKSHVSTPTPLATDPEYSIHDCNNLLKDVCLKESGFVNTFETITATLDGEPYQATEIDRAYKIVSPYWSKDELNFATDASLNDDSFSYAIDDNAEWIPVLSTDGNKSMLLKAPKLNGRNPFLPTVDSSFNSRNLAFIPTKIDISNPGTLTATVTSIEGEVKNLSAWLPFTIFGIYNDETPIYNANRIILNITQKANWITRLFSMKPLTSPTIPTNKGKAPCSVTLLSDSDANTSGDISVSFRLYKPPTGILDKLDRNKTYIRQRALLELDIRSQDVVFSTDKNSMAINSASFDTKTIPQRMYFALIPKLLTDDDILTNTNHYCRFDKLTVEMFGTSTILAETNDSEKLYHICKENGLQMNKQEALYLRGFPVCLKTTNNLGYAGNNFVGVTKPTSGKHVIRVTGSATRLHTDHLSFKSTDLDTEAKRKATSSKTYEMVAVFVYSSYLYYNFLGKKFGILESLDVASLEKLGRTIDELYVNFIPEMSLVGGSVLSVLGNELKGVGKGLWNVLRATISNKDGIRDQLYKHYKGAGSIDSHSPMLGGNYAKSQIIGGKSLSDYQY